MPNNSQQIAGVLEALLRAVRGRVGVPWTIVLLVLAGGYLLVEPLLEARLGIDLPGVHSPQQDAMGPSTTAGDVAPRSEEPRGPSSEAASVGQATPRQLEDVLEEVGRDAYRSPGGLLYTRGSVHGHRLKHLMAHASDDPDRPGQHGVFDETDPIKLVQLIDQVYLQARSGEQTRKTVEGERTVYTIDVGRRVGYIGGESGARRTIPPPSKYGW